jgi:hypothetical protein
MEVLKEPRDLEQSNRQIIIKNLNDVYSSVEKLIQRTYAQKEADLNFQFRNIRTNVSQLLADIKNKQLDTFSGNKGSLEELYRTEDNLLNESIRMKDTFSSLISSTGSIDVFLLEGLIENFKKAFNDRIIVDRDILKEFKLKQMESNSAERVMSGEKQRSVKEESQTITSTGKSQTGKLSDSLNKSRSIMVPSMTSETNPANDNEKNGKEDIETDVLSKLYNYMNILEHKYSSYQPEVSFNGEYIGKRKWKVNISDKLILGNIMATVFKSLLTFETYWHPFDDLRTIVQFVQREANAVPAGQYKSLCILNSGWNPDIKEWVQNYMHPRMTLYLCNLETNEILFNSNVKNADRLKVWHNLETYTALETDIEPLIVDDEAFDASDVAEMTGLSTEGANRFLSKLLSENKIIDVGFGTARYKGIKK